MIYGDLWKCEISKSEIAIILPEQGAFSLFFLEYKCEKNINLPTVLYLKWNICIPN